jgi:hypothetical protein
MIIETRKSKKVGGLWIRLWSLCFSKLKLLHPFKSSFVGWESLGLVVV